MNEARSLRTLLARLTAMLPLIMSLIVWLRKAVSSRRRPEIGSSSSSPSSSRRRPKGLPGALWLRLNVNELIAPPTALTISVQACEKLPARMVAMFDDQSNDALALLLMPFHEADSEITALTLGLPPESEKRRKPLIDRVPAATDGTGRG